MAKRANELFNELTAMDATRLARELEDSYRQLFTLRLQVAIGKTKRKIARIKTLQRQRELVEAAR